MGSDETPRDPRSRPQPVRTAKLGRFAGESVRMVAVLDDDPALGWALTPAGREAAGAAAIAPLLVLRPGEVEFRIDEADTGGHLGLLVLAGVVARHLSFGSIGATDFFGPGDVMRPWPRAGNGGEAVAWRREVLAPVRIAVLDEAFASRIRAWPELHAALLDRAAQRSDFQALQVALHQAVRVEDRVLLALWHFAGRWGETRPEGRAVSLTKITGEVLARFVG